MSAKLDRRLFLAGAAGLALSGCDRIANTKQGEGAFQIGSDLTYESQRALLGQQLAPEYEPSTISAFFKPNGSIEPMDPACKKLAATALPRIWLPAAEDFLQVDEIPILGSGKLDLRRLKEIATEGKG